MRYCYVFQLLLSRLVARFAKILGSYRTDRNGMDGNWSTTELWVGNVDVSEATMNLIISTTLSETWVVGSGGCVDRKSTFPPLACSAHSAPT